ncbi:MAG: methyltransferase domain-containing protein [Deltaproteobacteria bacterium]|nr:methyltransferase domain-containing protein [Deltaproteobacteria bacterium]
MAERQVTKESQARTLRGWMLGLHATHIIDIGGRLGYFAELKRRGGAASAQELAAALQLNPWRTEVWCRAACTVGVLGYEDGKGFTFAPFMDELLGEESPELLTTHVLASLSRDFPAYPEAFRTGATKTFYDHDADFFSHQGRISALRAPEIVATARKLPGIEERLTAGGKIMDIGSGSGTVLVRFAEEFPASQVTGIEPLPYFIESSRRLIQERELGGRVRVEPVGGEQLNFDGEFDLITMVQVFHELPDRAKAEVLRRCQRSLKPGGVLLLVDRCSPANGTDLRDRRFTMSILEQWFEVTWGNIVNTRSEILRMLQDTGFSVTLENADLVPTYWTFAAEKAG